LITLSAGMSLPHWQSFDRRYALSGALEKKWEFFRNRHAKEGYPSAEQSEYQASRYRLNPHRLWPGMRGDDQARELGLTKEESLACRYTARNRNEDDSSHLTSTADPHEEWVEAFVPALPAAM